MDRSKPSDKAARHMKMMETLFLVLGILLGVTGVLFLLIHHRWDLLKANVLTGAILVGIGSLTGCIYKTYIRLVRIEEKIDKLSAETESSQTAQQQN